MPTARSSTFAFTRFMLSFMASKAFTWETAAIAQGRVRARNLSTRRDKQHRQNGEISALKEHAANWHPSDCTHLLESGYGGSNLPHRIGHGMAASF